jgi:hypothetical protein
MALKITYLLGAGASANALPLIKGSPTNEKLGLPGALKRFAEQYKSTSFSSSNPDIAPNLASISDKCIEFGTPDLYAKFLLETGDLGKYALLKKFMANYFHYEQTLAQTSSGQGRFDYRTLAFLTTIAQKEKLPSNISILSWNYDRQIEIAAKKLMPVDSKVYNSVKGFTCWPNYQESYDFDDRYQYKGKDIFLLHLNGVAGFNYSKRTFSEKSDAVFNFEDAGDTLLSFAWEDESNDEKRVFLKERIEYAKSIAEGTQVLVVIGYSFPFFNRKVDDIVIDTMRNTLTKIYYQDPGLDGSRLFEQFNLNREFVKIDTIPWVDNYYIPYEL